MRLLSRGIITQHFIFLSIKRRGNLSKTQPRISARFSRNINQRVLAARLTNVSRVFRDVHQVKTKRVVVFFVHKEPHKSGMGGGGENKRAHCIASTRTLATPGARTLEEAKRRCSDYR